MTGGASRTCNASEEASGNPANPLVELAGIEPATLRLPA